MKRRLLLSFWLIFLALPACKQATGPSWQGYAIEKVAHNRDGMVVSAHPLATQVGVEVLQAGGNAVDAAIAVQFALAVVYPVAGNIGGGGFMVIRMADGTTDALDFREKAPGAAFRDMYLDSSGAVIPGLSLGGHLASGVPGSVDGMVKAFEKYSKIKDFSKLIQPAINLADHGFHLTDRQAKNLNSAQESFVKYNTTMPVFVRDSAWQEGDLLIQADLAQTLIRIRDQGREGFYGGKTADLIAAEMEAGHGIITRQDLQDYQAIWRQPLQGQYRDYDVITMPPSSSGGVALLQLLESVEDFPMADYGFHSTASVHAMIEAERRVYADRAKYLGDTDFYPVPIEGLTDPAYNRARMADFDPEHATPSDAISEGQPAAKESEQTTHFSVVDSDGNAVSVTTTINGGYGCKTVVAGAGFLLNNDMDDFSSKPGVPNMFGLIGGEANSIQPGKRMLSSMTPSIVAKDGELFMVVGSPGGSTIITSVFQMIVDVVDFGMTMDASVQSSRFHHQWKPDYVFLEPDSLPSATMQGLREMGYELNIRGHIGRVDAILRQPDGTLVGAADPRGDDHAAGY
ncbi:MAG: gamma-glutamyltransferase [Saprospiraceae bacterium]